VLILFFPFALAGIALINCGLARSRGAAHSMLNSLAVAATAMVVYFSVRRFWEPGLVDRDGLRALASMFAVGLSAIIAVGAAAERWRLVASIVSTALFAGIVWPASAHLLSGDGWLARNGFVDSGGSAAIHAIGGLNALAITRILGPRRGKYPPEGPPAAIPGHSAPFVLFGCFVAWIGWLGLAFSSGGMARFGAVNTTLGACSALLAAILTTQVRFGKIDASLCANGWVGGLVASGAGWATLPSYAAIVVGAIAGVLVVFSVEWLELHLKIDDPGGAVSVHGVAGLVGVFSVWRPIQLAGVGILVAVIFPATYALNWVLNRVLPQRVPPEAEQQGLDLHELGAGAYPDFQSYNEDLW